MPQTYTKADRRIVANSGDTFVIELEGNPTTGYEWQLEFDQDKLELLDEATAPLGSGIGAGSAQRFELRASHPGHATIRAIYKRQWEANPREQETFEVDVTP